MLLDGAVMACWTVVCCTFLGFWADVMACGFQVSLFS